MRKLVVACQNIRDELMVAMAAVKKDYPVVWIDSEYHIDPALLHKKLQETIDNVQGYDTILLAFGCCGNALIDLQAKTASLIIPKTDDCISLLLTRPDTVFQRKKATYFLTKGWIESPKGLIMEYRHALARFGEKRTEKIFKSMLHNYKYLMLIDTGAYEIDQCLQIAQETAKVTNLELLIEKGHLWYLEQLLTGPYDDHFCLINKGETVKMSHFGFTSEINQQLKF